MDFATICLPQNKLQQGDNIAVELFFSVQWILRVAVDIGVTRLDWYSYCC